MALLEAETGKVLDTVPIAVPIVEIVQNDSV